MMSCQSNYTEWEFLIQVITEHNVKLVVTQKKFSDLTLFNDKLDLLLKNNLIHWPHCLVLLIWNAVKTNGFIGERLSASINGPLKAKLLVMHSQIVKSCYAKQIWHPVVFTSTDTPTIQTSKHAHTTTHTNKQTNVVILPSTQVLT